MKKLLIVEDEELLSQLYEDVLKKEYEVSLFHTGQQALVWLKTVKPDLAILDVKLPDISGLKLIKEIKTKYPDVPVIMVTAYDASRTGHENWLDKTLDYIVKPVVFEELKTKIKTVLDE
ncbi:MAG: hypothetical protein A3J83_03960 [Elusimicrobia bacterium RIFOXYA2_FULL_40_6]|nr:MAG: hypothetical protein A3J83_03960 [Elusimicrobia bacterium RIFOXYA2_FULL_40_6]